jgi:polyisoprenoid-binding protein YceI
MKVLILLLSICATSSVIGQNIYKAESGKVRFFSDALLEDIEATTNKTTAALNASTGDVAVLIPIKSFEFAKSLMKEHFNENYLESNKYPDASFKGKIADKFSLTPGANYEVTISGELLIHGVSQHRDIVATLKVNADGSVLVSGKFSVKVADHKVKIPTLVFQNIAEIVEVSFTYTLKL